MHGITKIRELAMTTRLQILRKMTHNKPQNLMDYDNQTLKDARLLISRLPLQWRHNERDCVSNQWRLDCFLNRLFRGRSKLRVTGVCEGNSPVTGEFPTQRARNVENISISWRHHVRTSYGVSGMGMLVKINHAVTKLHRLYAVWQDR